MQLTQSLKEECLKFFDSGVGLSEMGSFLKETISDHEKCKCLETFIDCKEIVVWLKDNSESKYNGFVTNIFHMFLAVFYLLVFIIRTIVK